MSQRKSKDVVYVLKTKGGKYIGQSWDHNTYSNSVYDVIECENVGFAIRFLCPNKNLIKDINAFYGFDVTSRLLGGDLVLMKLTIEYVEKTTLRKVEIKSVLKEKTNT